MTSRSNEILEEQTAYYCARASEYDQWWQRQGRYDHGPEVNAKWQQEVEEVAQALLEFCPSGDVLELACGTGWWTHRIAERANSLVCLDASAEVLALNKKRLAKAGLSIPEYHQVDLFKWTPQDRYDVVFFSFWLSHVPSVRFDAFWRLIADALKPGGRVFFLDSLPAQSSTASNQSINTTGEIQDRVLNDGQSFRIVKLYYDPVDLKKRLAQLGLDSQIHSTANYFLYGSATVI